MNEFLQSDLWLTMLLPLLETAGKILLVSVPLMIGMAMLTYAERKVIGAMQLRRGPNVVGPFGLLQPFADGLKLFLKETIIPTKANRIMFLLAPMITFALALLGWAVIPFSEHFVIADLNVGVLYLLRDLLARRLRYHHLRLGLELEICLSRRHPLQRANGLV